VQKHLHPPRALLDRGLFQRVLVPNLFHRLNECRRFVAARVGEDRLPAGPEEPGYQVGEGRGVLAFVEDIGGEDEVKGSQTTDVRCAPVEEGLIRFQAQVRAGVVGREIEGSLVVVRRKYRCAAGECD